VTTAARPQYAALRDLTAGGTASLLDSFTNLGSVLADAGVDAVIEYQIGDSEPYQIFSIQVAGGTSNVSGDALAGVQLRVIMAEQTWRQIASGATTPADAFLDGLMRVQGDTALGTTMLKHLAGTPGRIGIC
jgi:putative sterol carrier protein